MSDPAPMTDGEVVRLGWQERDLALADAIGNRDTHICWRDHLREHPDDPRVDVAGDLDFHERAVREYDRIVRVLNYALHPQAAEAALADARRAVLAEMSVTPDALDAAEIAYRELDQSDTFWEDVGNVYGTDPEAYEAAAAARRRRCLEAALKAALPLLTARPDVPGEPGT